MKLVRALLFAAFILWSGGAMAQDIHYSLYNMSPLTLNPANTGAFEGTFRIGGIFRDQWYSFIPREFTTPSVYLDAPVANGFGKRDWIGVGLSVYQDKVGSGNLSRGSVLFSAAYHLALDKKGKTYITLGGQGGYVQRRFDQESTQVMFEDELELGGGLGVGNSMDRSRIAMNARYVDVNAGVILRHNFSESMGFNLGFSAQHLTRPKYNILTSGFEKLPIRFQTHAQFTSDLGEKWMMAPTAFFSTMSPASELAFQAWGGRYIGEDKGMLLRFGAGYRWKDAAELLLGFDYKGFQAGLSYDLNVSKLNDASNFQGGFELAVSYIVKIFKEPDVPPVIFCPRL
ncbi:MAG: PorP/SprF family type IX secretion system membrane protein [Lewinellaceae bacterium]|nr:PorP/SprF family type IX secretion system membrane protein [Lewinellaceae bacterium]